MTQGINTLIIETVGSCNLRCKMCPTNNYTAGKSLLGDSIFEKIPDIIRRYDVKVVDMTGWGEPLLDPKLEERIIEIKQTKCNIFIGFSTNGTLFTKKRIAQILKTGIDHICISFDAGSKETYEKIRINSNSNYEKLIENLKLLSSLRDEEKTKLSAVSVIMKENFHEMDNFVELFYKLGFDFVTFKPLDVLSSKENLNSIVKKKLIQKRFLNLKEKYRDKIIVCGWDLSTNEIENDCLAKAASGAIFINCIGDVSPCCNLAHHVPNVRKISFFNYVKKDNFFSFGNIFSESFERIIESEMYKNFINAYKDSHLPEPCKGCRLVSEKLSRRMRKI